ncbi:probable E3 ubiquitin-protein ligase XERICO [Euphorbia lathyris]|uniref:probable E3 ubiquitin-protein ligase XERICO n=1 Tax=Euphorbia lathyris TaxID=212925 RepID=UPI0033142617
MGLSSLPGPSEGVLCVILVNTALSISLFKGILRSILHVIGIHLSSSSSPQPPPSSSSSQSSSSDYSEVQAESYDFHMGSSNPYINEFRSRSPATRFDSMCRCKQEERECSVCLTEFEGESEINYLGCGHLFHKVCLEKWLDYWNFTCPLCRSPVMPEEEARTCIW